MSIQYFSEMNDVYHFASFAGLETGEKFAKKGRYFWRTKIPDSMMGDYQNFAIRLNRGFFGIDIDTHFKVNGVMQTLTGDEAEDFISIVTDIVSATIAGFNIKNSPMTFRTKSGGVHTYLKVPRRGKIRPGRVLPISKSSRIFGVKVLEPISTIILNGSWIESFKGDPEKEMPELYHYSRRMSERGYPSTAESEKAERIISKYLNNFRGDSWLPVDIRSPRKGFLVAPLISEGYHISYNRNLEEYPPVLSFPEVTIEAVNLLQATNNNCRKKINASYRTLKKTIEQINLSNIEVSKEDKDLLKVRVSSLTSKEALKIDSILKFSYSHLIKKNPGRAKSAILPHEMAEMASIARDTERSVFEKALKISLRHTSNSDSPYHQKRFFIHSNFSCCLTEAQIKEIILTCNVDMDTHTQSKIKDSLLMRDLRKMRKKKSFCGNSHGFLCPNGSQLGAKRSVLEYDSFSSYEQSMQKKLSMFRSNPTFFRKYNNYRVLNAVKWFKIVEENTHRKSQVRKDLISLFTILQAHANTGMISSVLGIKYINEVLGANNAHRASSLLKKARKLGLIQLHKSGAKSVLPRYKVPAFLTDDVLTEELCSIIRIKNSSESTQNAVYYDSYNESFYTLDGKSSQIFATAGESSRIQNDSINPELKYLLCGRSHLLKKVSEQVMEKKITANKIAISNGSTPNKLGQANPLAVFKIFNEILDARVDCNSWREAYNKVSENYKDSTVSVQTAIVGRTNTSNQLSDKQRDYSLTVEMFGSMEAKESPPDDSLIKQLL